MAARRSALWQLTLMRVREFGREPEAVFWTFFFPIIMAIALGVAFRGKGEAPVYVAVVQGAGADHIASTLEAGHIHASIMSDTAAREALRKGKVGLVVSGTEDRYVYRYDPTQPDSRIARLTVDNVLQVASGRRNPRVTRDEPVSEKGSRYIDFLIPGLIGLNLLSTGLWGVGYTVVQMRKEQLLKRFMSTPMRRGDFLLSFMIGRLVFLVFELALLLGFAWIFFRVPVRGSLITLTFLSALGAFTFTGLGLLIASRARTTESVQGYMNLAAVPMWVLSGVFFSADHFPAVMQPFIQALPLTALNNGLRAIMLDGTGIAGLGLPILIVTVWGVLSFGAAVAIFRWR